MRRAVRATYDEERVLVWQAHRADIADEALQHGRFGGASWSLRRHTVVRLSLPSLLHRVDFGRRKGRERVLGLWLRRDVFDALLQQAVHRVYEAAVYGSIRTWRLATRWAQVSVEWHDDLGLDGHPDGTETLRIGLRQEALRRFNEEGIVSVFDLTSKLQDADALAAYHLKPYPLPEATAQRLAGEA